MATPEQFVVKDGKRLIEKLERKISRYELGLAHIRALLEYEAVAAISGDSNYLQGWEDAMEKAEDIISIFIEENR